MAATFQTEGPRAALRYGAEVLRHVLRRRSPVPETNPLDHEFGTDTARSVKLHNLDIASPNYRYGVYYRATTFRILDEVLARLPVVHSRFTFVDFGSGKGLVVLKAATYPYRKVIGVEFARELHERALINVEMHPADLRRADIELVHKDILEFEPPAGDLVLYLFEPFEKPVTEKLLARIDRFRFGRQLVIAYVWSRNRGLTSRSLWEAASFLTRHSQGDGWTIYRALSAGPVDFGPSFRRPPARFLQR
jgi:predicted nicotinamide N-methyase